MGKLFYNNRESEVSIPLSRNWGVGREICWQPNFYGMEKT